MFLQIFVVVENMVRSGIEQDKNTINKMYLMMLMHGLSI